MLFTNGISLFVKNDFTVKDVDDKTEYDSSVYDATYGTKSASGSEFSNE